MLTKFVPPSELERNARTSAGGMRWLRELPVQCERYLQRWQLTHDPAGGRRWWSGHTAVVLPVRCSDGTEAVLKLSLPRHEARREADALAVWNGRGAVRLLDTDTTEMVLLLERLDGNRSLLDVPPEHAAEVWGTVTRDLSIAVPAQADEGGFARLAEAAERWTDELPADWEQLGRPFERRLLGAALEVCQVHGVVGRRTSHDVLVHSDLHYGNILAGTADPDRFVAIAPKPVVGDAEFSLAPMLSNRMGRSSSAGSSDNDAARDLMGHLFLLASAAGLDPELARQWSLVREVRNALGACQDGRPAETARSLWVAGVLACW